MSSAFSKDSWVLEENFLEKNLDSSSKFDTKLFLVETKFKYLKPIFFDENVRFDLEIKGDIVLEINEKNHYINSDKLDKVCILVKDGELSFNNIKEKVNIIDKQFLKVVIKRNSIVNTFNIISDLKIDTCNPTN